MNENFKFEFYSCADCKFYGINFWAGPKEFYINELSSAAYCASIVDPTLDWINLLTKEENETIERMKDKRCFRYPPVISNTPFDEETNSNWPTVDSRHGCGEMKIKNYAGLISKEIADRADRKIADRIKLRENQR